MEPLEQRHEKYQQCSMQRGAERLCFCGRGRIPTQDTKPVACIHWHYSHPVPSLEMLLPTAEKQQQVVGRHTSVKKNVD